MAKTKSVKKAVKKTVKKVKAAKPVEVAVEVEQKTPQVTQATKDFICNSMGKMSTREMADKTQLTEEQVIAIATSIDLDITPEDKANGVAPIRRYDKYKGAVAMTAAQSRLDDMEYLKNLPKQEDINKAFGPDFQKIQRRV